MNMIGILNKVNTVGKYLVIVVLVLNLASLSFASTGITSALKTLCKTSQAFLGIGSMLLIVLAGAIYAVGQMLGAETRARASVWATAMMTGAVIGIIIYILTPPIISALLGGNTGVTVNTANPCG